MAKLRKRAKRSFLLLVALCVLALLLELNRFLPGDWAGGGGGGFQAAHTMGTGAPDRRTPERSRDERPDEAVVRPPEEAPEDWPPREGVRVELRGPSGDLETRWRLGAGAQGGDEVEPDGRGVARTNAAAVFREGFRLVTTSGHLHHAHGLGEPAAKWVVQRPDGRLPTQRAPGRAGVRVLDAALRKPVAGAKVAWRAGGHAHETTTDATGEAVVRGDRDGRPVQVEVSAKGYETRKAWVSPRERSARSVGLDTVTTIRTRFQVGSGGQATPTRATLRDAGGRVISRVATPGPSGAAEPPAVVLRAPGRTLQGAWLEVDVATPRGGYVFRVPVARVEPVTALPPWREIEVRARDVRGLPRDDIRISAEYSTFENREDEPLGLVAGGQGTSIVVPSDRPLRLLVESPGTQPVVRRLASVDGSALPEFVLQPAIELRVAVRDARGKPLPNARVVLRQSIEGIRIVRSGPTDAQGLLEIGPLAPGAVEVFAVAEGHACAATLAEARAAMGTVEMKLPPGYPLTVIVEDPFGIPLEGVDVTLTPTDGGPPLVSEPDADEWRTDENGRLRIERLPNRLYDVGLSLPGRKPEKLRRVQPGAVTYFATLLRD